MTNETIDTAALAKRVEVSVGDTLILEWRKGAPPKPWSEEWFIAITTYGDRVVLRALPEDYTYDFKTADETYILRDKIAKWMQFPDSEYVAPPAPPAEFDPDLFPFAKDWGGYALLLQARKLCEEIEKLPGSLDQTAMINRASEVAFALQQFQMTGTYLWRPSNIPAPPLSTTKEG